MRIRVYKAVFYLEQVRIEDRRWVEFRSTKDMPQWLQERVAVLNLLEEGNYSEMGGWKPAITLREPLTPFRNYYVVKQKEEEQLWRKLIG
jgi:hypothetical protein